MGDRITVEPGLNSGLPDHGSGLDPDTKAAMERNASKDGKGVIVGGIGDVQRFFAEVAKDDAEPTVQIPRGEDASSPTSMEHDALTGTGTATAAPTFDDSYTKQEIQDELDRRGVDYNASDTKDDLLDKLNG